MLFRLFFAFLLCSTVQPAIAQDYPSRTVKLVVPFAAGAANDIIARLFAQKLSDQFKQPFVVENRAGGAGIPGAEYVAKSAPDGYTLLLGNTTLLAIQVSLYAKLPYDPQRDFVPVSILAISPSALVVHPSLPVHNLKELIDLAKASPGKMNYASAGNGTPFHLSGELFKAQTGTNFVHVPYKGNAPALVDLLAGQVQLLFANPVDIIAHVNSGKLRAIVSTGPKRLPLLPNIPTMAEAGFRNAESVSFFTIVTPGGTPRETVAALHGEVIKAGNQPDVRQRLLELGCDPVGNTPAEAAVFIRNQIAIWAKVIKESGARVDN